MSLFSQFLKTIKRVDTDGDGQADLPIVDVTGNYLNWSGLGKSLIGAAVGMWALGVQRVVTATAAMHNSIITGLKDFYTGVPVARGGPITVYDGLIGIVAGDFLRLYRTAWEQLAGYGWLGYLVGVAGTLMTLFVVAKGVIITKEVILGE